LSLKTWSFKEECVNVYAMENTLDDGEVKDESTWKVEAFWCIICTLLALLLKDLMWKVFG